MKPASVQHVRRVHRRCVTQLVAIFEAKGTGEAPPGSTRRSARWLARHGLLLRLLTQDKARHPPAPQDATRLLQALLGPEGNLDETPLDRPSTWRIVAEGAPLARADLARLEGPGLAAAATALQPWLDLLAHYVPTAALLADTLEDALAAELRKRGGVHYTPPPLVRFMCQQALSLQLQGRLGLDRGWVHRLLRDGSGAPNAPPKSEHQRVLQELSQLHVMDLAVGPGTFLLGMFELQLSVWQACHGDQPAPDEERARFIRGLIANRLRGVDLQAEALEVTRLRLWLAGLAYGAYGGDHGLPALHWQLAQGDSLLGRELDPVRSTEDHRRELTREALATLRDALGQDSRARQLHASKAQAALRALQRTEGPQQTPQKDHALALCTLALKASTTVDADPRTRARAPFMPVALLHQDRLDRPDVTLAGFDIVIGNPPYVRIQGRNRKAEPEQALQAADPESLRQEGYRSTQGAFDLYAPFVERGLELLHPTGTLCYLLPSKFQHSESGRGLRQLFARGAGTPAPGEGPRCAAQAYEIVDFLRNQPFAATTYTQVLCAGLQARESLQVHRFETEFARGHGAFEAQGEIGLDLERINADLPPLTAGSARYPGDHLGETHWRLPVGERRSIMEQIERSPCRVGEFCERIFQGVVTGADPVYVLELVEDDPSKPEVLCRRPGTRHKGSGSRLPAREVRLERNLLMPCFHGGEMDAYFLAKPRHRLLFPYRIEAGRAALRDSRWLASEAPESWLWLKEHEALLRGREGGKLDHPARWWGYSRNQNLAAFTAPRLSIISFSRRGRFSYSNAPLYFTGRGDSGYGLTLRDDAPVDYWCLLAMLNSALSAFYLQQTSSPFRGGYVSFGRRYISRIPVQTGTAQQRTQLAVLAREVTRLRAARRNATADPQDDEKIRAHLAAIDAQIFDMHGLERAQRQRILRDTD